MQIEVVDDCSTMDDPEAVVRELGAGRVLFSRQPQNVGHVANFNTCLQRSKGRLVHLLHGDDLVCPGFYERMGAAFASAPEIGAAFCRHAFIDDHGTQIAVSALEQDHAGVLDDWLERIAIGCRLQAPSMVVRRIVYEHVGGFDPRIRYYGEDWEMWVRIAVHYPVWYQPEMLAMYRSRTASLSGRTIRTGENMADLRRAVECMKSYLPEQRAPRLLRKAALNLAGFALKKALWLLEAGDPQAAAVQIREAVRCGRSVRTSAATLLTSIFWVWKVAKLPLRSGPGSIPYVALRRVLG
jgi:hypothetical protein